jgi:hypothetical protein
MATSRRKFIKAGALGALFAAVPLKTTARGIFEPTARALTVDTNEAVDTLNMRAFAQQLNSDFRINHNNVKTTTVKLVEVKDLRVPSPTSTLGAKSKECFSAVFVGARRPGVRQGTYTIEHPSLGTFSLLLVPVGLNKNEQYYEAIFNRLH